jgi:hypothetical protein
VPDRRSLLRGQLATAIGSVADVAAHLDPPAARTPGSPRAQAPPGRPWTLAAAMEPVTSVVVEHAPPPLPPHASGSVHSSEFTPPYEPPSHHRLPVAIIGGSVIGIVAILAVVLRLIPSAPATPNTVITQVALTAVRPVASSPPVGGPVPPTQISFPAGTKTVSIDVNSATAKGQAPVEIVVSLGDPALTILDNDYVLDASGDTLIPLTPSSGTYAPGEYSVTISHNGVTLGSTAFDVR